jgi:hypothetical protein
MMDIMAEFYSSELFVPYTTKAITNFCATLTTEGTRDGDLAEVERYFEEIQEKDPDFYFCCELDAEDRVVNIFWVDGAARKALIRLKRIYNFLCSMLVYIPFSLSFVTLRGIFMHFLELTY